MLSTIKEKLRNWLRRWLGLAATDFHLEWHEKEFKQLRHEFNEQMNMIGVDVGLKNDQTVIIFISRLGREGGTVRIVPAHFSSVGQLMDFIQYTDRSFDPKKVAIDAPYGMGRLIEEERRRRR